MERGKPRNRNKKRTGTETESKGDCQYFQMILQIHLHVFIELLYHIFYFTAQQIDNLRKTLDSFKSCITISQLEFSVIYPFWFTIKVQLSIKESIRIQKLSAIESKRSKGRRETAMKLSSVTRQRQRCKYDYSRKASRKNSLVTTVAE